MEFFRKLGSRTRQCWSKYGFDEACFPDVCMQMLEETPPAEYVNEIDFLRSYLETAVPPPQPRSGFGQPPVVAFEDRRFYIELLFWMDGTTALHQHSFSGAFHVLAGSSIQGLYEFQQQARITSRLWIGQTRLQRVELLRRGDTRPILAGKRLIHSLFHLQRPSVTVVIRTRAESDYSPQYNYIRPYVAYDPFALDMDDLLQRAREVFNLLGKVDPVACDKALEKWVLKKDLTSVFGVLEQVARTDVDTFGRLQINADLLRRARRHLGDHFQRIFESCQELQWQTNITARREDVTHPDHRYFLALLLNVPNRPDILRLAGDWSGQDPVETVLRWTRELTTVSDNGTLDLLGIQIEPDARDFAGELDVVLQTTLRALIEGTPEAILPKLCEHFPEEVVARQARGITILQDALKSSLLRPVVRI